MILTPPVIALLFLVGVALAWLVLRMFTTPPCPRCRSRSWDRNVGLTSYWQCRWCRGYYDPFTNYFTNIW